VEPRDHGLEYEEDVCPHPRLTRPCAAWRRESRRLPVNRGDHNAIWTPPNVPGKLAEAKSSSAFCYKASVRRAARIDRDPARSLHERYCLRKWAGGSSIRGMSVNRSKFHGARDSSKYKVSFCLRKCLFICM
jgi:hypothetical protein